VNYLALASMDGTLKLLRQANKLKMLEKVQPQRLRDELILILKEEYPLKPLMRIKQLTGLGFINSGLSLSKKTSAFLKSIAGQISWFERKYTKRRQLDAWLIYFIGLVESLRINTIKSICKNFAFRRGEEIRILDYKRLKPEFIRRLSRGKIRPSEVFRLLEPLSYEVIVLIKAKFKNANLKNNIEDFCGAYNGMRIYISGSDLHKLGLVPGPDYQKIFHRVLNARLDGMVKTKKDELELIKKIRMKFQ